MMKKMIVFISVNLTHKKRRGFPRSRQQTIWKTHAKRYAYQVLSVTVVLLVLVSLRFISYFSSPKATTGAEPIGYRGALLSTLLYVSLIPTSHNRPSAYQLERSATEHSSTCKSHCHKPQQA
jgi:hypothetical protein